MIVIDMRIGQDPLSKVIKAISIADHLEARGAEVVTSVDQLFNHLEVAESDWIVESCLTKNYRLQ